MDFDPVELIGGALGRTAFELLRQRLTKPIYLPNPVAGADFTSVVPAGVAWEVLSVRFAFVTSAVVANRVAGLQISDADNVNVGRFTTSRTQTASLNIPYTYAAGIGASLGNVNNVEMLPSPPIYLLPGWKIGSSISALDVGDQISGGVLLVREWSVAAAQLGLDYILDTLRR